MTADDALSYMDRVRLFQKDARLYIFSNATASFSFGIANVIFNLYMVQAGFGEDFLGFFLSVSMFAVAGIAILAGLFSDRRSRKKIVLGASTIAFFATAAQYSILDPTGLLLSQVFLGLSNAFNQVSWTPYITDLSTDEERAHLFGFSGGVSLLSVLVGNLLGGYLPSFLITLGLAGNLFSAYQLALWVSLVPYALSTVLVVPMTTDRPIQCDIRQIFGTIKNKGFIGKYATTTATIGLGAGMIVLFFNLFFEAEFTADAELIGVIFAINTVVLASGNFLAPALSDRIGKVKTVVFTEALSIPFLLMISWAPYLYLAVIAYVSRTVLMNMAGPVSNALFMEGLSKEERATAVGIVRTGDSFVRGVAAIIGGWLLAQGLYRLPYVLVAGLYVLGIVLFYGFFKDKERELEARKEAEIVAEKKPEESVDIT